MVGLPQHPHPLPSPPFTFLKNLSGGGWLGGLGWGWGWGMGWGVGVVWWWHDTSCHNRFVWIGIVLTVNHTIDDNLGDDYHLLHRRSIVCEDLPAQNIQFVRNENPNVRIP